MYTRTTDELMRYNSGMYIITEGVRQAPKVINRVSKQSIVNATLIQVCMVIIDYQ